MYSPDSSAVSSRAQRFARMFHHLGLNQLFVFLNRKRKRILTYHNILPAEHFGNRLHEGVSHSETVFRQQIAYVSSKFRCGTALDNPQELTITFDDGYLNQYAIAHPVLRQFNVKAYFFCTLDLLQNNEPLLIDQLMFWLSYVPYGSYEISLVTKTLPQRLIIQCEEDRRNFWSLAYLQMRGDPTLAAKLRATFDQCYSYEKLRKQIDSHYFDLRFAAIPRHALTEMREFGHCIGAHTKSHPVLSSLNADELEHEVKCCADEIGKIFNCTVFSYPFGGAREVSQRQVACVRSHGFTHAVSNINHPISGAMRYTNLFLPRLTLPNSSEVALIAFILSGAKYFLQYRRLLPKVASHAFSPAERQ